MAGAHKYSHICIVCGYALLCCGVRTVRRDLWALSACFAVLSHAQLLLLLLIGAAPCLAAMTCHAMPFHAVLVHVRVFKVK
jgi:hypothetical protein